MFIRISRIRFCYTQLCGRCLVNMTAVVKVVIHCDYYNLLAIGIRSAFFSMKAAELKCQNLIVTKVCKVVCKDQK